MFNEDSGCGIEEDSRYMRSGRFVHQSICYLYPPEASLRGTTRLWDGKLQLLDTLPEGSPKRPNTAAETSRRPRLFTLSHQVGLPKT